MKNQSYRLAGKAVFWVSKKGKKAYSETIRMKWVFSKQEGSKYSVVASIKTHPRAIKRNLVKRRMREAVRPYLEKIKKPADMVFFASKKTIDKDLKEISREIHYLLKKERLIK